MTMTPAQEEAGRAEALDVALCSAAVAGLPGDKIGKCQEIFNRRWKEFRRALRDDPPGEHRASHGVSESWS